jgi:hypothetical protein
MLESIETLVVTFFEHPCLTVRASDGNIYLSLRDLCEAIGLQLVAQRRRLNRDPDLRDGLVSFRVPTGGGPQEADFLMLEYVSHWVTTVNRTKASLPVQERLRYLRLFTIRHVYDAIARAAGLPEGQSRNIEDLRDLERFDDAIQGIADRQRTLEESQQKARQAWRDLDARVRALEGQARSTSVEPARPPAAEKAGARPDAISTAQRGHIYQLVQLWAAAYAERNQVSSSEAFSACWGAVKTRYRVAKYEHIPAERYADCVTFISTAYKRLTGADLHLPSQGEMELGEL